jgi:hypothetical protein
VGAVDRGTLDIIGGSQSDGWHRPGADDRHAAPCRSGAFRSGAAAASVRKAAHGGGAALTHACPPCSRLPRATSHAGAFAAGLYTEEQRFDVVRHACPGEARGRRV